VGARGEGVQLLDDAGDDEGEAGDGEEHGDWYERSHGSRPPDVGVQSAEYALREVDVYDVEDEDTGIDEDVGREGKAHAVWVKGPCDSQNAGYHADHGEACGVLCWFWKVGRGGRNRLTEHGAVEKKPVVFALVDLQVIHVGGSAPCEKHEEDGADGDIGNNCHGCAE